MIVFLRLLRPGGVINGFEVPFPEGALEREAMVLFNTWGHNWEVGSSTFYILMSYNNLMFRSPRVHRVRSPTWASTSSGPC